MSDKESSETDDTDSDPDYLGVSSTSGRLGNNLLTVSPGESDDESYETEYLPNLIPHSLSHVALQLL